MATTFKLTKLAAVNIILSTIGQAPLTSLNTSNPLSSLAEQMLDEVNHALQSEGWVFNTEQDYPFTPDNNKNIEIPANVLSLDKTESLTAKVSTATEELVEVLINVPSSTQQLP